MTARDERREGYELAVIAPCYNEELNLPELTRRTLAAIQAEGVAGELVLVDDGSADATAQVIRELVLQYPGRVVGCYHEVNRGITPAWRTGVDTARGKYVSVIDADLQYQPEDALRLYRTLLDHSVDVAQGWRSHVGRERGGRYWVSRAYNHMLNGAFGMHLRDNKSGFVCCAKEVMLDLLNFEGKYHYWQSFIMVAAHAKGYSYKEVETLFEPRKAGVSFLDGNTARASLRSLGDITRATIEYRWKQPSRELKTSVSGPDQRERVALASAHAHPARWQAFHSLTRRTGSLAGKDLLHSYEALDQTQWLSAAQLRNLQDAKLRRLIRHVYRTVAFYRHRMQDLDLRPEDIRGQQDLAKLQLLTKQEVRENLYFNIISDETSPADMTRIATSGSTGEPLVCYADDRQRGFRWAAALRAREWAGYRFGDPSIRLVPESASRRRSALSRAMLDLSSSTSLACADITEAWIDGLVESARTRAPVFLEGHAEVLDFVAQYVASRQGSLVDVTRAVLASGQELSRESRRRIELAFGAPVFDRYGCRELALIAHECEARDGYHVVAEGCIVEVLVDGRPARPGETGEIVVTDLNGYCMPLVRYALGDLATVMPDSPCTCGRGAPKIRNIAGRVPSIIVGTEGRHVPGTFFARELREYGHALERFQVLQDEPGAIRFRLVKGGRFSDEVLDKFRSLTREHLGAEVRTAIEVLSAAEMAALGARRASVSRIPPPF